MELKKIGLLICCLVLLISGTTYLYQNRDIAFKNVQEITNPWGCLERYVNGKLVTPSCDVEFNSNISNNESYKLYVDKIIPKYEYYNISNIFDNNKDE